MLEERAQRRPVAAVSATAPPPVVITSNRTREVHDALKADDSARAEAQIDRLRPIEELRAGRGDANNVAVIKAAMDLMGLVGGGLRPPLSALDPGDSAELLRILRKMELLP